MNTINGKFEIQALPVGVDKVFLVEKLLKMCSLLTGDEAFYNQNIAHFAKELELKRRYNKMLTRLKKAMIYLEDDAIPNDQKEKYLPAYESLKSEMQKILWDLGKGNYSKDNILDGFKEEVT